MAKPYKIPDFRKMYPEASEEVIAVLRTTERKMQYQEYDLKRARNIVDPKTGEDDGVEDQILQKLEFERLHKAILTLSKEEQWLIHELYFENQTEREVAKQMGVYHNAVHKQKKRILEKLKKILEKN